MYTCIHGAFSVLRAPLVGPFDERNMDDVIDHDTVKSDRGSKMTLSASVNHILIAEDKVSHSNDGCGRVNVQTL